jgi:hypothetical protein
MEKVKDVPFIYRYICFYVCALNVHIFIYICEYIYIYICIHIYMYTHMNIQYVYMDIYLHIFINKYTATFVIPKVR